MRSYELRIRQNNAPSYVQFNKDAEVTQPGSYGLPGAETMA